MSVYKHAKSPFYQYDFVIDGRRFLGSTKARNKKDALALESKVRDQAKQDILAEKQTGNAPLTIDVAAGRYWNEIGQHHAGKADTFNDLARLVKYFGNDKRMDAIDDGDLAALVAWRRVQTRKGRITTKDDKPVPVISPSTVNRSTTGVLKKLFTRARKTWRYQFPKEPIWKDHWLKEPEERVRELQGEEADAIDTAIRDDYAPWLEFCRVTGLRLKETLLRWTAVNFSTGQIRTLGKGGTWVTTPITPTVRAILEPLKGDHPEFVFTFVCRRPRGKRRKGQRYPITYEGAKTEWQRTRARAGIEDFRFHDIRHDVGTKTLRETGNLKLVQKVLNHRDIKTTTRYAHVLDDEVAAALERVAQSRKKSRNKRAKASNALKAKVK